MDVQISVSRHDPGGEGGGGKHKTISFVAGYVRLIIASNVPHLRTVDDMRGLKGVELS